MASEIQIKICCISSSDEARCASDAGADYLGLVGPMPSGPGILDHSTAQTIAAQHRGHGAPILLTASTTAEAIAADAARVGVSHVQVVRHIDPAEAQLLSEYPLTYFQVIHIEDETALTLIETYAPFCDVFLLDSGRPSQDTLGGTGKTHDWRISAEWVRRAPIPTFLAGGLTADNIADAIKTVRPAGVDICSGIRRGGALDPALLASFIKNVKSA